MIQRRKFFRLGRAVRSAIAVASLPLAFLTALTFSAEARGGHGTGMGRGFGGGGMHGAQFANGRRHGNDSYIKAASEDRDKLLNEQLKSICRGC